MSVTFAECTVVTASSDISADKFPFLNIDLILLTELLFSCCATDARGNDLFAMQWNLNIQRQLSRSLALTLGYVGSAGVHLAHPSVEADMVPPSLVHFDTASDSYIFPIPAPGTPIQRINQGFGSILYSDWSGQSNYHALQANLVQRPVKGLTYQIAYTWSKSIDNGSNSLADGENRALVQTRANGEIG
jgi:hypothetical protein